MINTTFKKRYCILCQLGKGRLVKTYLAVDLSLPDRPQCVVKEFTPLDPRPEVLRITKSLFKQKITELNRLGKHDRIAHILTYFEENGKFYVIQEYIEGRDLNQEIRLGQKMSQARAIALLVELLKILHYIHSKGVICGDLNLETIRRRRSDRQLMLVNFAGIKETMGLKLTDSGEIVRGIDPVNSEYTPQEQTQGEPRFCSDIYALGRIVIQALTGIPHDQLLDTDWKDHFQGSEKLVVILDNMIAESDINRYQDTSEVLADLDPIYSIGEIPQSKIPKEIDKNTTINTQKSTGNIWPIIALSVFGVMVMTYGAINTLNHDIKSQENLAILSLVKHEYQDAESYWKKGNSYYFQEEYEKAIAYYTKALELDPQDSFSYYARGNVYLKQEKYQLAIADYNRAIDINPNYAAAYYNRGLARDDQDIEGIAFADYIKAIQLNPIYSKAYGSLPYINRANIYYQKGEIEKALAEYDQAIQINPDDANLYNNRGSSYYALGEDKKAIADYTQAIKLNPNIISSYRNRAQAYSQNGDDRQAIADYTQAIQRGNNQNDYHLRGWSYEQLGAYEKAISDYTTAIEIGGSHFSTHSLIYNRRGWLYYQQGEYEKALADYIQANRCDPNNPNPYYNKGLIYQHTQNQLATSAFHQAAFLYEKQGNWQGYKKSLDRIREVQIMIEVKY